MICYEDTKDPVLCPYCNSESNCEHLFAIYDKTFDTINTEEFLDIEKIEDILRDFFITLILNKGFKYKIKTSINESIENMWMDIVSSKNAYYDDGEFDEEAFFLPNIYRFIFDILYNIVHPEIGEFNGGPGQSSSYEVYYTDNFLEANNELTKQIEIELIDIKKRLKI